MGRLPSGYGGVTKKGTWTPEEDLLLTSYVQENGPGNWESVSTSTGIYIHLSFYVFLFYKFIHLISSVASVCVNVYVYVPEIHTIIPM